MPRVKCPNTKWPSPENPRKALESPDIARLFHQYITEMAPWYDLSDPASMFGTRLPRLALEMPLPFSAIIAQAAMQISQTTAPGQRPLAEFYHGHCVRLLIELREDCGSVESEAALAAVCLLRSYEILDGKPPLMSIEVDGTTDDAQRKLIRTDTYTAPIP
ncbi:hypothetical protein ACHAQH_009545 [Verticillium albo-atrum]